MLSIDEVDQVSNVVWGCFWWGHVRLPVILRCVLCPSGLVAHGDLDERAIEALKEFNEDGALQVLVQFKESDLSHVQVSFKSCET